ncbi:hypothetical protein ACFQ60_47550 [Streptomyces zhihengii]
MADLIRKVVAEVSPEESAWAFSVPGSDESQAVEIHANGKLEAYVASMLRDGLRLDRLFIQGRVFRHEAEVRLHAMPLLHRAQDVVDTGLTAARVNKSTLSVSTSAGTQRTTALRIQAGGVGAIDSAAPGRTPLVTAGNAVWNLYQRIRIRAEAQTLGASWQMQEERSGRKVRAGTTAPFS